LKVNQPAQFRVHANLVGSGFEPLSPDDLHAMVQDMMPAHVRPAYEQKHEVDFSSRKPTLAVSA